MKSFRIIFTLAAISILAVTAAQGQATRTWVSHNCNDANPCTVTSPCLTFQGAYAKTPAGGEIDVLDAGDFGPVTITNSITIDGGNQLATISVGTINEGIYVDAPAGSLVTLRNLSIRSAGAGIGVYIYGQGVTVHIEHCVVSGFSFVGVFVVGGGSAINFYLDDSIIRDNEFGVYLASDVTANISNSHLLGNSHYGLGVIDSGVNLTMTNSEVSGNRTGAYISNSTTPSSTASIANSVVANNTVGVDAEGAEAAVTLSNVSLFNNTTAGYSILNGGVVTSFRNNANTGTGTPTNSTTLR